MGIALIASLQAGKLYYLGKQWHTAADNIDKAMIVFTGLACTGALICCALITMGYH